MGVSVQFIGCDTFVNEIMTNGMIVFHEAHTGHHIKKKVEERLQSYGLKTSQVYTYTTDNGKNVLKATKELLLDIHQEDFVGLDEDDEYDQEIDDIFGKYYPYDATQIRCAAHTIQLAVNDFLGDYNNTISNMREKIKTMRPYLKSLDQCQPPLSNQTR